MSTSETSIIIQLIANVSTALAVLISIFVFVYEKRREQKIQSIKAGISVERIVIQWSYVDMVLKESFPEEYQIMINKDYKSMRSFDKNELAKLFKPYEMVKIKRIFAVNTFNSRNIGSPQLVYNVKPNAVFLANSRYKNVIKDIIGDPSEEDYLHVFHRVLIDTFNKIETLCTMVKTNVADRDAVFDLIGASLSNYIKSNYYYIVNTNDQYRKEEKKLQNTIYVFRAYSKKRMGAKVKRTISRLPSVEKPWEKTRSLLKRHPVIPNTSIYSLLKLLSHGKMKRTAIECHGLTVDYKKMFADIATLSKALKSLGIKSGEIVAICMPNIYQSVLVFFACNRIGAVATFLNPGTSPSEIVEYVNKYDAPLLFCYDCTTDESKFILEKTNVKYIINLSAEKQNNLNICEKTALQTIPQLIDYHCLGSLAFKAKKSSKNWFVGNKSAMILYTSGSTGHPKSVVLTNKNIIAALMYANNTSNWNTLGISRILVCVPFAYPYGFITSLLSALFSGSTAILAPNIGKDTVSYYYSQMPQMVFGSPALLDLTMNNIPENQNLSSVKYFVSGGDFLTQKARESGTEFFHKHHADVEIGNGFGNAETVSIATTPVGVRSKPETVGIVLTGSSAIVIDPETFFEKQYGEEGLLCISGKHIFKEYYGEPQLTKDSIINISGKNYFKTGTRGFIDKDGYFTLTGRASRFYICSSLNKVYLDHVQSVISRLECIRDCAAVKVPDDEQLFVNYAFVVLNKGTSNGEKDILNFCKQPICLPNGQMDQLKDFEIPQRIVIVDELPRRSGTDKIDYRALEKQAEEMSKE